MLRGLVKGGGSGTPARPTRVTNRRPSSSWKGRDVTAEDLDELRRRWHRARIADTAVLQLTVLVCLARVGPGAAGVWGRPQQDQLTPAGLRESTVLDAKMSGFDRAEGGVVQAREVGLQGGVGVPHCGQEGSGLSVVDDNPAIDCFRDDRPAKLQLLERVVWQQLKLDRVLEGTEQCRAPSGDRRYGGRRTVQLDGDRVHGASHGGWRSEVAEWEGPSCGSWSPWPWSPRRARRPGSCGDPARRVPTSCP